MDTITLKIEIVGLCLFATQKDQLFVLLPDTSSTCGHHDMVHHGRLGWSHDPDPRDCDYCEIPFENASLDLSHIGGDGFKEPILSQVTPLIPLGTPMVSRRLLVDQAPHGLKSRVRITSGKEITVEAEGMWRFEGHPECLAMTQRTKWIIENVPRERMRLALAGLHGNTSLESIPDIAAQGDEVHVRIRHSPENEREREPCVDEAADHFACYYGLFPGTRPSVLPQFVERLRPRPSSRGCEKGFDAGDLIACMSAKAPVEP